MNSERKSPTSEADLFRSLVSQKISETYEMDVSARPL